MRFVARACAHAFHKWTGVAEDMRRQSDVLKRVVMRMWEKDLAAGFTLWNRNTGLKVEREQRVIQGKLFYNMNSVLRLHLTFSLCIGVMRLVNRLIAQAFLRWHEESSRVLREEILVRRVVVRVVASASASGRAAPLFATQPFSHSL